MNQVAALSLVDVPVADVTIFHVPPIYQVLMEQLKILLIFHDCLVKLAERDHKNARERRGLVG